MSFDNVINYEDRTEMRTSRWSFDGIITKDSGNTAKGWVWYSAVKTGDNLVVTVYKDAAGASSVALSASTDISTYETAPVLVALAEANSSGITGQLFVHDYTSDVTLAPIMVSLIMDEDIELIYARSDETHMSDVYDSTNGYARFCAKATEHMLMFAASQFAEQMGGFGAEEDHNLTGPARLAPIWSSIVAPEQMKDAAVYYACWLAFLSADETDGEDSMLAFKAEQCKAEYDAAKSSLTLVFDTDNDEDADTVGAASDIIPNRV